MKPVSEYVDYLGERFYVQSSGRYYSSGDTSAEVRLLHRRVWSDANGPIPDGMVVHHKDGDWRNNEINNLELMPVEDHSRMHMVERWAEDGNRAAFRVGLEKAREAAKAWHASDEGIRWHSENARKVWETRTPKEATCSVCSSVFLTFWGDKAKFCSKSCTNKVTYKKHKTSQRTCAMCGDGFLASKYRATAYCSRACSNRHRSAKVFLKCEAADEITCMDP